eukprot:TRINITY_DN6031_c0_g1_i1.p1 TRINITY_DN6031_c0_g1~~TRINITY_DN6031_c0_g1_i1.p1  ORF type:complete len:265 (+),score=74.02 TRINITY_DN6031_c0_g1_i1:92-886(+)
MARQWVPVDNEGKSTTEKKSDAAETSKGKSKGSASKASGSKASGKASGSNAGKASQSKGGKDWDGKGGKAPETKGRGKGKGEGKSSNSASHPLAGKSKEVVRGLNELCEKTPMRLTDLDPKAMQYLDALDVAGKLPAMFEYLKSCLEQVTSRDKIANWTPYMFTLIRKFDAEFYGNWRENRGRPKAFLRDRERTSKESFKFSTTFSSTAKEFVPGSQWMAPAASSPTGESPPSASTGGSPASPGNAKSGEDEWQVVKEQDVKTA